MNWADERYVRIYTRDTPEWLALSFIAQGIFHQLLRKVDRTGVLPLGKLGRRAVAVVIGHPGDWARLESGLDELLADGCVEVHGDVLVIPNFIAAQEATMSGALRTQEWRERERDRRKAEAASGDETSRSGDEMSRSGDDTSPNVTSGDEARRGVTPSLAEPIRAEPSEKLLLVAEGESSSRRIEDEVLDLWNQTAIRAGLPKSRGSEKLRKTIRARLKTAGWLDAFKAALPYVEGSAWTRGLAGKDWKADLDWLLRDGNAERYADRPPDAGRAPLQLAAAPKVLNGLEEL